jgi:hypothetical protein
MVMQQYGNILYSYVFIEHNNKVIPKKTIFQFYLWLFRKKKIVVAIEKEIRIYI